MAEETKKTYSTARLALILDQGEETEFIQYIDVPEDARSTTHVLACVPDESGQFQLPRFVPLKDLQ